MVVGVCRLRLLLPGNRSLKGKRKVVKSIIGRTRSHFNLAMAEVEDNDLHGVAVLGFAVVGNEHAMVNATIDRVVGFVEDLRLADLEERQHEILHL